MAQTIENDRLYTEEETRALLGNIGKTKLWQMRKANCIAPFRTHPTLYLGAEIRKAMVRVTRVNRKAINKSDYGL